METAALVISIFAVLLSVVVAGWAIQLQWSMFKASSHQLNLIGRESARLGQRLSRSLGQIQEATTTIKSSLDTTVGHLLSGSARPVPASQGAVGAAAEETEREMERWRVEEAVRVFRGLRAAPRVLEYLAGGARDRDDLGTQLVELRPEGEDQDPWMWDIAAIIGVSNALDLLAVDPDKGVVTLSAPGRQVAARLSEGADD